MFASATPPAGAGPDGAPDGGAQLGGKATYYDTHGQPYAADEGHEVDGPYFVPINTFPINSDYVAMAQMYGPGPDVPVLAFANAAGPPQAAPAPAGTNHSARSAANSVSDAAAAGDLEDVALRLLLPNNMVGSIIGKGGVTIKEITQQSNARIHINHNDDSGSAERLVAVLGTYDEVVDAHRMIAVRVQEEAYADLADSLVRDGVISAVGDLADRMSLVPLKMLVPNVAVGRLIGRGGFNVKRLMAESDAYIVCSREEGASRHAQPTERVLTVMGSPHGQTKALRSILELVGATLDSASSVAPDPGAHLDLAGDGGYGPRMAYLPPPMMPGMYVGANGQAGPARPGAPIPAPHHPYPVHPSQAGAYGGLPHVVHTAPMPPVFAGPPLPMGPPGPAHFGGGGMPAVGPMWGAAPPAPSASAIPALMPGNLAASSVYSGTHWSQAWDTVAVYIPAAFVGAIIGRNGSIIKELSSQTRCAIWIVKNDEDTQATEKAVLISGRIDAQFRAQFMIHNKVVEASAGHPSALEPFRVDMLIPNDMIGRIIGKKGAQVRQISDMSGARLIINRDARFPLNSALTPLVRSSSSDTTDSGPGSYLESSSDELPLRMRKDDAAFTAGDSSVVTIVGRLEATLIAQQYIRELVHYHRVPERGGIPA